MYIPYFCELTHTYANKHTWVSRLFTIFNRSFQMCVFAFHCSGGFIEVILIKAIASATEVKCANININPNTDGYKKVNNRAAGSHTYMTLRRLIGHMEDSLWEPPPPLSSHSCWSSGSHIWLPAGWTTQKHHRNQVETLPFLLKNHIKLHFLNKNFYQNIIVIHLVRKRSRIQNIFTYGHCELHLFKVWGVIYAPQPSGLGLILLTFLHV